MLQQALDGFRASDFGFVSNFDIRVSDLISLLLQVAKLILQLVLVASRRFLIQFLLLADN